MPKIVQKITSLRIKSEDVSSVEEAKDLISQLEAELSKSSNGVGLAAIQIGYPKRVGVIKNDNGYLHLINPVLVEGTDEIVFPREGCLSFPNVFHDTKRFGQITIRHQRIDGDKFVEETFVSHYEPVKTHNLLECIAIQHELDHFEGKLIIDFNIKGETIQRESVKVGRNDPCPCGSGKKYKKCCLEKKQKEAI
jgi:peptide deformylase